MNEMVNELTSKQIQKQMNKQMYVMYSVGTFKHAVYAQIIKH